MADDSTLGQWQAGQHSDHCSRAGCLTRPVARLNRGQYRHGRHGRRVDAWWHYCAEHLADYGRVVRNGEVVFVPREVRSDPPDEGDA